MFGLDPRRLLGSLPAVLAATLPSNKFCLLYILPCVWKFFSNPFSDHNTGSTKGAWKDLASGFLFRLSPSGSPPFQVLHTFPFLQRAFAPLISSK